MVSALTTARYHRPVIDAAMERLVRGWDGDPSVAEAVVRLERLARRPALTGSVEERGARFRALLAEKGVASLGVAIASFPFGLIDDGLAQLELLSKVRDPRVGDRVVQLLASPPYRSPAARGFWQRALRVAAADPRAASLLRARRELVSRELAHPMSGWIAEDILSLVPERQVSFDPAVLASIEPVLSAARVDASELYQAVWERPFDDDVKRVLADRLLEQGDPRGELINLQFSDDPKAKKQAKQLLEEHGRRWLGALEPVILKTGVAFRRGFLDECHLKAKSAPALEKVIGASEWSTVRSITEESMGYTLEPLITKLFLHPILRSLRVLGGQCSRALFHALTLSREERAVESLVHGQLAMTPSMSWMLGRGWTRLPPDGPRFDPDDQRALTECPGLPNLRELDLTGAYHRVPPRFLRWFFDGALGHRLSRLTTRTSEELFPQWLEALDDHPLPELVLRGEELQSEFTFRRDAHGRLGALSARFKTCNYQNAYRGDERISPFTDFLLMFPHAREGQLSRVEVVVPKKEPPTAEQRESFARHLKRLGVKDHALIEK